MGDRHDYVALEWVKGEIGETLKQARQAIETFVENPREPVPLYLCRDYVHQVHGTLQMVEFYGAALLAEEMEQLTEALVGGRVSSQREALETLMQAILQLPLYLERVQEARRDLPVVVLPLLNDLRTARGEGLISETSLFAPDLSSIPRADAANFTAPSDDLVVHLRKFRQMLQVALAGVVRNQDVAQNLGYMAKVFERLERMCQGMPIAALWGASLAVVEGLQNGGIANGASVRNLLRQVDREFKALLAESIGLGQSAPEALIKQLLFYVAKSTVDSPNILRQKQQYRLQEAMPDAGTAVERVRFAGPDRDAMRSAIVALCEELVRVKDSFDLFVRSEARSLDAIAALLMPIKQIADTLAMLGLGSQRKLIQDQYELLQRISRGELEAHDATLMEVAGALLSVESSLSDSVAPKEGARDESDLLPSTNVGQIHQVVVKEARKGLEQAKDAMIEFIVSQWDHDHLRPVPALLSQIRGGLAMIPLPRVAGLLDACNRYIQEQMLANDAIPDWQNLDTLADAITSVEYYLERLVEDPESENDAILDVAQESLLRLGYMPDRRDEAVAPATPDASPAPETTDEPPADRDEHSAAVVESTDKVLELDSSSDEDSADASFESLGLDDTLELALGGQGEPGWDDEAEASDDLSTLAFPEIEPRTHPDAVAELSQADALAEVMASPVEAVNPPARDIPPSLLPPPSDEEPVDEELREVFIEEAEEVLETLNGHLPAWRADPKDRETLGEIRRAFHTLKGSGRMVRALVLGELAWSVENLLNRVLDGTRQPDADVMTAVDRVVAIVPELIGEYAANAQRQRDDVDLLAANAHALAKGQSSLLEAASLEDDAHASSGSSPEPEALDPQLVEVFRNEAETHLQSLANYLDACSDALPQPITDDLQRALHTLKGSASMAGIEPIAQIAAPLERMAREYKFQQASFDLAEADLLAEGLGLFNAGLEQLELSPLEIVPGTEDFQKRVLLQQQERLGGNAASVEPRPAAEGRAMLPILADGLDQLLAAEELLQLWRAEPGEYKDVDRLLAALREVEQGARKAGVPAIESLSVTLGDVYRAVGAGTLVVSERFFDEVSQAHDALVSMIDQVAAGLEVHARPDRIAALESLLSDAAFFTQLDLAPAPSPLSSLEPVQDLGELDSDAEEDGWTTSPDASLVADESIGFEPSDTVPSDSLAGTATEPEEPASYEAEPAFILDEPSTTITLEEEMVAIFLEEAADILESINQALDAWLADGSDTNSLDALQRDLHTLKGGARMAEVEPIARLAHELEGIYEGVLAGRFGRGETLEGLLEECHDMLAAQLDELQAARPLPDPESLVERIRVLRHGRPTTALERTQPSGSEISPEAMESLVHEGYELTERMSGIVHHWDQDPTAIHTLAALQRDLHSLKGSARQAGAWPLAELAHEMESVYDDIRVKQQPVTPALYTVLLQCHDALGDMLDACRGTRAWPDEVALIEALRNGGEAEAVIVPIVPVVAAATDHDDDGDDEILDIFHEEATELLEEMEAAIAQWEDDPSATEPVSELLRILHTLKGGARLAGLTAIGDLAHELEQSFADGDIQPGQHTAGIRRIQAGYERLSSELGTLRSRLAQVGEAPSEPIDSSATEPSTVAVAPADSDESASTGGEITLPFMQRAAELAQEAASRRTTREMVKVQADLLDGLVNLAGETSIFRGRVEQQVSDFAFTLGEMDATIERVRDQLRRLDTETQAQILSRHQAEGERAGYEEFDPLEMDRYSQLQQLSRSLFESASDLLDLKETLAARSRDAETLLQQQAWVNTELQEGLMRTRMVPFERMVPRLRRIVRQVSAELGKQVDFTVGNAEGELDRTVLERMIAPLEHMLRNAVDHGIESEDERTAAGKPAAGRIRLTLEREAGDILITLNDDGRGISLDAVRRKAVERGLLSEGADLSDQEVLQFILESGFSTADRVTQISGRGVGMDVVHSEVKQLGGSMNIESVLGQGTRFTLRLPFTVSVNRALMVRSGDDTYAVPLNTVEGIVRVSAFELEAMYASESPRYEYAGEAYELVYLGDLLENGQHPKLVGQSLPLPIILVRSSEHAVAVQVDALAGSREIVVKSLGPQFAAVPGLSGATILGDGRVVVILDLLATIRARHARAIPQSRTARRAIEHREAALDRPPLVMVVDDSITVRKVTGRLIERNGMNVITAKDGVDAITQLQEHKPDIMLLDIEMPRMDGFEVATLVRHDEQLKGLPIIMITSRTGEKHRERALAIGVNEYLGKPYQESTLLSSIQRLVGRYPGVRHSTDRRPEQ